MVGLSLKFTQFIYCLPQVKGLIHFRGTKKLLNLKIKNLFLSWER